MTVWMKPISTLMKPLRSVDLSTMVEAAATIERSDVCAVPAAAVVGEAMVSLILADALLEKFGSDSVAEIDAAWERYQDALSARLAPGRSLPDVAADRPVRRVRSSIAGRARTSFDEDLQKLVDDMIETMYARRRGSGWQRRRLAWPSASPSWI